MLGFNACNTCIVLCNIVRMGFLGISILLVPQKHMITYEAKFDFGFSDLPSYGGNFCGTNHYPNLTTQRK